MWCLHAHPDHFFGTNILEDNPKIIGHEKLNRSMYSNYKFYKNYNLILR